MTVIANTTTFDSTSSGPRAWRWLNRAAHWIAFAVGMVLVIAATHLAWKDLGLYFQHAFSALLRNEQVSFKYDCTNMECVRCLDGVAAHPDGVIVTGASGAIWGFDLALLQRATSRPIINCTMNGTKFAMYGTMFNVKNKLKPNQIILHFVNTWDPLHNDA